MTTLSMGESAKVRFSRDGDQFHYLWAARRCLSLLTPSTGLSAISIEGPASDELGEEGSIEDGEEVIDVGEYYGSQKLAEATSVRYIQLKHSTQLADEAWKIGGLKKTIKGFAARYTGLLKAKGGGDISAIVRFVFLSNRPISDDVTQTIQDISSKSKVRHPKIHKYIEDYSNLTGADLVSFCAAFELAGDAESHLLQRQALKLEFRGYLAGNDADAPVQLKDLVTRKATSEFATNPNITKYDVLRTIGVTELDLFPAPPQIEKLSEAIPREQEQDLAQAVALSSEPTIIRAAGGVGKTIFSQMLGARLGARSQIVTYDCFGNGTYRRLATPRHRHKDALVQIVNELASRGLCDLLIPTSKADPTDYLRAFSHRMAQCVKAARVHDRDGLVCIAIDAADNAEMAAREFGEGRSFVPDLLNLGPIEGLRIVAFCRPEREHLLSAPAASSRVDLKPFSLAETSRNLRAKFPRATNNEVAEFHKLTSSNPRLQATALSQSGTLKEILRSLGPLPTTVDDAIAGLLRKAVQQLRERVGSAEQTQIDTICAALAILRPLVPTRVLAAVSGVPKEAVESFAYDLGRPLLIAGDAVQFRDEPVETWFRKEFRPSKKQIDAFIEQLKPLSANDAYVASTLPQLLLEAERLDELVELALNSSGLPESNPVERRDIELNRLQFALKASLRAKNYVAATKLAMKAAEETAGDARQLSLFQNNTDIAANLLTQNSIQEIVSRRAFGGGWVGSHHAYEAGLLSYVEGFRGDALSRARMAHEWLGNWSRLPPEDRQKERIDDADVAELAMVALNINGAAACAAELDRWSPKIIAFRCGRIVAKRLVDHGKFELLNELASTARSPLLALAICLELRAVSKYLPREVVERLWKYIQTADLKEIDDVNDYKGADLLTIVALVESAARLSIDKPDNCAAFLKKYLPESPPYSVFSSHRTEPSPYLRAYSLQAELCGVSLTPLDLASASLREQMDQKQHSDADEIRKFKEQFSLLIPWYALRSKAVNGVVGYEQIKFCALEAAKVLERSDSFRYREERFLVDEIAQIWFEIVAETVAEGPVVAEFLRWIDGLPRQLYSPSLIKMARTAARHTNLQDVAHDFARKAFLRITDEREDAESKAETYVGICRALYSFDKKEAAEYFNQSVEVVSKFGDEVIDRWQAAIDLATAAADPHHEKPELAYNFARCSEVIYDYMARDKYFDWEGTVKAIADLCPSSFFAIASRWRDRNFGVATEILPEGCLQLLRGKRLDPQLCAALVGFRARWQWGELLGLALAQCSDDEARIQIRDLILRYMRLDGQSASTWSSVISILDHYQLQVSELAEVHAYQLQSESGHRSSSSYRPSGEKTADTQDWEKVFEGLDLTTVDGISTSFQRFKAGEPPFYTLNYARELYSRVPSNKVSECVSAFADVPQFELYQYSELLEAIPAEWRSRFAVRTSLAELGKRIAHRHCLELIRSRFYRRFSIDRASALLGVAEQQFSGWVIEAIGRQQENLGAERLFSLVGLLTGWLSRSEAEDALLFGLSLFEPSLDGEAGDGPWSERLRPPSDVNVATAGYIWSQLAAPSASLRWEAAHVVTALGRLGSHVSVASLVHFAGHGSGLCFADSQLHFYGWHARLWLMIALAKMAHERPLAVVPHADFLLDWALQQQPHVQIRHFAAKALRELASEGNLVGSATDADALAWVNRSKFPVERSKRYSERRSARRTQRGPVAERGFVFGYDTTEYWFSRLAEVFARTSGEVEEAAEAVILKDWKLDENGHWDKDARSRRGIVRGSHHHKDELSSVDDLNDYLSFHSMMVVAGKWLESYPVHQDPEDADDEFSNWLDRYLLCRLDGGWLADRRDEPPTEFPSWKNGQLDETWRWSVSQADFDQALISPEGRLNLWGHWDRISGSHEEAISITSALASKSRASALVRALQTCRDPMDYAIPTFDADSQLESGSYSLRGWIDCGFGRDGLDKADPWAAKIPYPTYKPAPFVCELLKLAPDREGRIWSSSAADCHGHVNVHVWGTYAEPARSSDHGGESGHRLQMSPQLLECLLKLHESDLIVKVKIERRKRYSRYESNSEHERGYIPPYCKVFCFNSSRQVVSLR